MQYKIKQFLFVLIKLSIVVGAFYFIYIKLSKNHTLEFEIFWSLFCENDLISTKTVLFLIILSSFNWLFEILKWQYLVKSLQLISFKSALEQSLGALTASLITPNRIGDYGAKAMYYTKPLRTKIVLLNFLGNMAQMTMTLIFGTIGFCLFLQRYAVAINYYTILKSLVIITTLVLVVVLIIKHKRFNIKGFSFIAIIDFIKTLPFITYGFSLLFSFLRYAIFSFQFYYLLTVFEVPINYSEAMILISSLYLLASIIPTISVFDVVIKGSVAVFFFSYAGVNELTILSVTSLMWLLNFVIPSIIGSYFVLTFKLPKPAVVC